MVKGVFLRFRFVVFWGERDKKGELKNLLLFNLNLSYVRKSFLTFQLFMTKMVN